MDLTEGILGLSKGEVARLKRERPQTGISVVDTKEVLWNQVARGADTKALMVSIKELLRKGVSSHSIDMILRTAKKGKPFPKRLAHKEDLDDLIGGLEEAMALPLKGRTTDMRQGIADDSPVSSAAPGGWLVAFPRDMYPMSQSFMGPVAVALAGHQQMSEDEYKGFLRMLHGRTYPRQHSAPAIAVEPGYMLDMRRLTRGGDYHPAMRTLSPASVRTMEDLVVLTDGILNSPLAHSGLSEYESSGKIMAVSEAINGMLSIAKGLVEPHSISRTFGDIVNRVAWPFSGGTVGTQRTL